MGVDSKINANNLCKWIMGSPRTSLELNFIEQLWPHTKFTPHQLLCWKRNLPFMTIELDTSNAAYSKITKEYTVLALAGIESILTLRNHSEAVKMRETLRKNINITESGVNWMCLIAGLRMHGTSADGVSFHRHMVQYFLDRSEYAIPKTIDDVQSLITEFLQTNTQNGTEVRIGQLIQLIARLRYGKRLEQLSLNKKNNCRRIALIASHIGRRLQILYPHAAIRKSSL